jgi:hypothetical protein
MLFLIVIGKNGGGGQQKPLYVLRYHFKYDRKVELPIKVDIRFDLKYIMEQYKAEQVVQKN